MSQISMPIRILLVCAIAFLAAWMLFLRPGPVETEPAAGTGAVATPVPAKDPGADTASAAGAAVQKATAAAGRTTEDTTPPAGTATATKPAGGSAAPALDPKALAKLPRDARRALERRKVLVVGVLDLLAKPWRPMADDDRIVRIAVRRANRYDGNVVVKVVSAARVARYDAVLKGLDVSQTPSVVVVDRDRKAAVLSGYVDRISINQAIADARRETTSPRIRDARMRRVNALCGRYHLRTERFSLPTVRQHSGAWFRRYERLVAGYRRQFAAVPARGAWKPLRGPVLATLRSDQRLVAKVGAAVKTKDWGAVAAAFEAADVDAPSSLDRRLDAAGLTSCVGNRRT
jgi:hypothetical protein